MGLILNWFFLRCFVMKINMENDQHTLRERERNRRRALLDCGRVKFGLHLFSQYGNTAPFNRSTNWQWNIKGIMYINFQMEHFITFRIHLFSTNRKRETACCVRFESKQWANNPGTFVGDSFAVVHNFNLFEFDVITWTKIVFQFNAWQSSERWNHVLNVVYLFIGHKINWSTN